MVLADSGRGLVQVVAAGVADTGMDTLDASFRPSPVVAVPANESSVTSTILQKIKKFPAFPPYHPLSRPLLIQKIPHTLPLDLSPAPLSTFSSPTRLITIGRIFMKFLRIPLFMVFYGKRQIMYS